jgi:lipopolysaccharide export system protein LptA
MILLLIFVPYRIEAGYVEILNKSKTIFSDGVKVYSEDLYIEALSGSETSDFLELFDNVYLKSKDTELTADKIIYYTPSKKLYAKGNIRIWKKDTIKGDSLIYYRDKEYGEMIGYITYISDSITVVGESGNFTEDTIRIKGRPVFNSPKIKVLSDSITYFMEDSCFLFHSNVQFEGSEIEGNGQLLKHYINKKHSILLDSPYIFQKQDSITGIKIEIDHQLKTLNALKGTAINYNKEGRNEVMGDTLIVYYNEESIDSVIVLKNSYGRFIKNETKIE